MRPMRIVGVSTLAAGIGIAGLLGVGLGTAGADPGPQCGAPNAPACGPAQRGPSQQGPGQQGQWQQGPGVGRPDGNDWQGGNNWQRDNDWQRGPDNWQPAPDDWQQRGIDQGRQDHQSFMWGGQRVDPLPAGNGAGWGFWFLGQWIPL